MTKKIYLIQVLGNNTVHEKKILVDLTMRGVYWTSFVYHCRFTRPFLSVASSVNHGSISCLFLAKVSLLSLVNVSWLSLAKVFWLSLANVPEQNFTRHPLGNPFLYNVRVTLHSLINASFVCLSRLTWRSLVNASFVYCITCLP